MDPIINPKQLSLKSNKPLKVKKSDRHHKIGKKFIKGPISLKWISIAARLPGKALHVALVLKFLEGLTRSRKISLSNKILNLFGVDRFAKARGLKELENANLIVVARKQGRSPVVTILSVE
jgi:hypothetical protein